MTDQTPSTEVTTETTSAPDLGALSFSDYERVRRGGEIPKAEAKAAPEQSEQKEIEESAPSEKEAKEDATDAEDESKDLDDKTDENSEKPKKKSGFQRRIDKLNAAKSAAQQEAEYWKAEALKRATQDQDTKPKADSKPTTAEGEPDPNDFDTHGAYVKALAKWEAKQLLAEERQKAEQDRLKSEQAKVVESYKTRAQEFAKSHPDYDEVLADADDIIVSPTIQQIIIESDNGPALAYELAKNREEFERINKLGPIAAAREMGKLESKISKASEEKKPETKITKAPKPLSTIGKSGVSAPKSIDDPNLSYADYERLRREQLKRKGR